MADEESTQPIDIHALRDEARRRAQSQPANEEIAESATSDESDENEPTATTLPLPDSVSLPESLPESSLPESKEEAAITLSPPPSTTRIDIAPSMPGTVPAHELVQALVAVMGARSERDGSLGETDESEALHPDIVDARIGDAQIIDNLVDLEHLTETGTGEQTAMQASPLELSLPSFDATAEDLAAQDEDTATNLPRYRPEPTSPERHAAAWAETEVTSVSPGRAAPAGGHAEPPVPVELAPAGHPADDPDVTRMGRLDQADVRAVFAAAEHNEATAVFKNLVGAPPIAPEIAPEEIVEPDAEDIEDIDDDEIEAIEPSEPSGTAGAAPVLAEHEGAAQSEPSIVDVDSLEIESVDDLVEDAGDDFDKTGENALIDSSVQSVEGDLPRFTLGSLDDIDASSKPAPAEGDIELDSRDADVVLVRDAPLDARAGDGELSYDDDEDGATSFLRRDAPPPSITARKLDAEHVADMQTKVAGPRREPGPTFMPPAPIGKQIVPAFEVDTDSDEDQLQKEERFHALLDLYRLRLGDADSPLAKATLLHKIASVHEYKLGEPQEAFAVLVEAFDLRPGDDDVVASLDRVGRELGRVGELAERARKNLHTADHELKVILLGHLVYWYERVLNRGAEMSPFLSELERLDKTHPVALRRAAQVAAANGDVKSQRELLLRALDRTGRRDEKVNLHLALASAHAGTPEAIRHYESALAIDASSVVALQGFERLGRDQGKHAQVEWCLERQVEVALTTAERVDALLKLAELQETKFLRREEAAEILERVIAVEPSHPQALKALERCYHALRDWPRLAKVLRARADNTYDKKQKMELLELAAEVFESKLGDAGAAVEVHRDLLLVDPKHRRALADLARLYEKLGDWGNMSTYKARAAELAPTKRQASQLLVQLGEFLAAPERDPIAARLQYERAVTIDPTNATAWEALQRVAAAAGDDRRVIECLEQRGKHVDGPRQRAAIYVELANVHRLRGDERGARDAFEGAVRSDPTNEIAAQAMVDVYSREEKWAEAAPLCELLVNAATRDQDEGALFTRLRLSTRIGAALGDADGAITSALAALDARPDDEGAQADLVAVCTQCRDNPRVVKRAKDWLLRIASGPASLPASVLVGLAQLQKDGGDVDAAASILERALELEAENPALLKELADVYLAQGDFPRCCKLMVDMARNATSADARFQLLCDAGEIWAKRADELDKAATVFEEARRLKPLDSWLLHTLMWLYSERHRWDDLSSVLESIAQVQESPERKAKSLFAMAQVVLEKMGDHARAAELFDQVLDIDRKRLDAFEALVRALTEIKAWDQLERSYRRMIARVKDDADPHLDFVLFQQLGLIYRDLLEDAELAYEALEAAARIKPDDAAVRKIVTELLVVTDNLDNAVARTRELVARDPHDAELYAELYELFLRQHAFDKAWCAVNVLAQMREPTPEQHRFHDDYAPMPLHEIPGQIVEQAWRSHVLHADLDRALTSLFAVMTPAVARMRYAQLRPDQLVYAAGRPFTPAHSRLYEPVRQTFANAAEILHMAPPDLLLGDPSSPVPFAPALAPYGSILVGVPAVEARAEALVYVVGKRLAEQRSELSARAFFPSVTDLTALLAAAVRVSRQEGAKDAAGAALDASLSAVLTPQEREAIRAIVMQTMMEGGLVDVKRWSQAADLSSMRAGLLLAGDVSPARKTMLAEPQSNADLPPREKVGELYKFATSDLYADLRLAIGVAVQA
ncbi:MAG: tetratricopeptide repeat protein [Labilithrix sp.]|nr:tetratricopeptide repeat protein [Labilithrix sp.]